jgi:hypothetical protein
LFRVAGVPIPPTRQFALVIQVDHPVNMRKVGIFVQLAAETLGKGLLGGLTEHTALSSETDAFCDFAGDF